MKNERSAFEKAKLLSLGSIKMSQSEPSEPEMDGNNGTSISSTNQCYKYDFVLNNYTETEVSQVKETIIELCKKGGFGKEVGESGTPHLQGAMWLTKKMRITALRKYPGLGRASFRPIRNDKAMMEYIQKDGDCWTHKFPKAIKLIKTLYDWQRNIEELSMTEPDDRVINWYWEPTGSVGKSAFCKYMIVKHKALYCLGGKHADLMNLVFNCDMDECSTVIFDIPRAHKGKVSYSALEAIKNGMVCNTKYETGVKVFNTPHIFVFANFPPSDMEQLSEDRWNVVEL